jgi:hypothetical protein
MKLTGRGGGSGQGFPDPLLKLPDLSYEDPKIDLASLAVGRTGNGP